MYSRDPEHQRGRKRRAAVPTRRADHPLEHWIGIYHEETIQDWALHFKPLIIAANYFYGSLHFVVTIAAGSLPVPQVHATTTRAFATRSAVAHGHRAHRLQSFPLMPPRLLATRSYGFVDTLAKYPTFWSFNSGAVSKISNQFAAMPSVHICWATWCALALAPRVQAPWAKVLAIVYPFFTLIVIVITANHYVLDAVGGLRHPRDRLGRSATRFTRAGRGEPVDPDAAVADPDG